MLSATRLYDDAAARFDVVWSLVIVPREGEADHVELPSPYVDSKLMRWDAEKPFHDANWTTFGTKGTATMENGKVVPYKLERQWDGTRKEYVLSRTKPR